MDDRETGVRRTAFSSTDPDVIHQHCRSMFGPRLAVESSDGAWSIDASCADTDGLGLATLRLGVDVRYVSVGDDTVLVETVREGRVATTGRSEFRQASREVVAVVCNTARRATVVTLTSSAPGTRAATSSTPRRSRPRESVSTPISREKRAPASPRPATKRP
ncbi:hypothetical protein FHX74_003776 [Friedmanniella endophytica]|uniref:Uncharacterized protein n=1 Tax=Microlunatus kandeliicorticis TaxID=1759536 RepID=A0A7W3IW03_9ACTN|nr:hypothetical protein [Microlunatus kandeliicorticis]MBA8796135.1 hypothetical protein [Microlunatus kandeliicorticis]